MSNHPCHKENLVALRRIEGQVRGIQKMIEDGRYCVDILTQLRSVTKAIGSVQKHIYKRHLESCVTDALKGKSDAVKQEKIKEIIGLMGKYGIGA